MATRIEHALGVHPFRDLRHKRLVHRRQILGTFPYTLLQLLIQACELFLVPTALLEVQDRRPYNHQTEEAVAGYHPRRNIEHIRTQKQTSENEYATDACHCERKRCARREK